MHCSENENVCSVKKENNLGFYRLHTIWKSDGFFINITSKDGAWRGEMTPSDISKMSAQLEMEPETYLSQCKEALTSHDGQPGMVYAVENGSFAWKKVIDEDSGMKIKMGYVMVEPTSFVETIQNLVHAALNCNKKLQKELIELTQEKKKLSENKNDLLDKLNELIITKNTMENDLYSKFILLLNSKKKKIKELEDEIEEQKKSESVYSKSKSTDNPYEADTDDDDYNSEEEILESNTRRKRKTFVQKSRSHSSALHDTVPDEKKVKKVDEDDNHKQKFSGSFNYGKNTSPEPSTSKDVFEIDKQEISKTNDELLDYFYGSP